jgi:hypothetical protein
VPQACLGGLDVDALDDQGGGRGPAESWKPRPR